MALIYFKQRNGSSNVEWTIYGTYNDAMITSDGDVRALVRDITNLRENEHLEHSAYRTYIVPEEVTEITKEEYESVISKIASAEDLRNKADEILKSLM